MTVGGRIRTIREAKGISQVELAEKIGQTKQTVYKYENDIVANIPSDKIEMIAKVLGTTPAILMGWNEQPINGNWIPVLGRVAAGIPITATEYVIDQEEITPEMAKRGSYFGLRIKGDSMSPLIMDGDTAICRQQEDAETDDIVIAIIDGQDGVCKKLKKIEQGIMLVSNNTAYEPMVFTQSEIDTIPVTIIGKVEEIRRKL